MAERTDKLLQEVTIWHELQKRMNGKVTAAQSMRIMELKGRAFALQSETTAANKAKEEATRRNSCRPGLR